VRVPQQDLESQLPSRYRPRISSLFQTTFRSNFVAGFDKYVERGVTFGPPVPPDVFWDPKDGRYETYSPQRFRFVDENLPSAQVTFVSNAGAVFDEITQQWSSLAEQYRQTAVWDCRRHKWVLAEVTPDTSDGNCRAEYEKQLRYLRQLHTQKLLTDEQFNKQANDAWEKYQHCVT
jgi:hypothetical protein